MAHAEVLTWEWPPWVRRRDGREEEGLCRIQRALARWKAKKNSVAEASAEVLRLVSL